ncbi:hypothetical protein HRbin16_02035 [bacterium HR16]|nr:hypothetical protein HRbin16_02035 [bacterium HR16]
MGTRKITAHTDGTSKDGRMGIGILIREDNSMYRVARCAGYGTSTLAEALAVLEAIRQCMSRFPPPCEISIYCDSEAVVKQVHGESVAREPSLSAVIRKIHRKIEEAKARQYQFHIEHVKRRKNKAADGLAYLALSFVSDPMWEDLGNDD